MTSEIKTRIEQIRRGEVPVGYKKTKTDIVPNDWKEVLLADCICEYSKKTTIPNQYPVLTSARKGLMLQKEYFTNRQVTTEDNVGYNILPYGYITFRSRSDDGKFVFNVNKIIERGIISYFYPVFSFGENVSRDFMLETLNHTIYKRMFPLVEGTAQQVLSLNKLGKLYYNVPTIAEQQKIAAILTDQDKIIELKENLLTEKQRQKKYLMQQLLTGRKRLSGFNSVWTSKKLGDICCYLSKHGYGRADTYVSTENMRPNFEGKVLFNSENKDMGEIDGIIYAPDDILIGNIRPYLKKVWKANTQGVCSPDVLVLHPTTVLSNFLYCLISNDDFFTYVMTGVKGSKMPRGDKNHIMNMDVLLPSAKEQCAITDVEHLITRELDLLRQDIEQEKQKKKALMQLLLTGIVRVNI